MSYDINMLRAKLRKALDAYGRTNGHACPSTTSNIDPIFHELFIAAEAASYFKSRYDKARDTALASAFDDGVIDEAVKRVMKNDQGEGLMASGGELYALTVDISRPAKQINQVALRNALVTDYGMSVEAVEKLFRDATRQSSPAKRVKVVGR